MLEFKVREYASYPPGNFIGAHEEWVKTEASAAALLLVNVYGFLLPPEHRARQGLVSIYGEAEIARREEMVRATILPVLEAARAAHLPVTYVADSAPRIALERSNIRQVMVKHLGFDPLASFAEEGNDPREFVTTATSRIAYAPELAPRPHDYYIRKWAYSGFYGTWLDRLLRNLGVGTLFCTGFNGDSDLWCTALDGMWNGYRIVLLRGGFAAVHVPECEPVVDFTRRLELYAETNLGYTISAHDFIAACRAATEVTA
jgi:nicotinamidase-related amidase